MKRRPPTERPTLDLVEEAVHLLRSAPAHLFGSYLLGTLPFLLGLLYFWTDMSFSAIASRHRTETAFGMALLFVWMKTWQSIFAGGLHARLGRRRDHAFTLAHFSRVALYQAIIQPSKLFVWPLAGLATIPFAWVTAFYENAIVLGVGHGAREFMHRSWRLARFSPRQNHGALAVYLLLVFVVFINVAVLVILGPHLLKMFTGVETVFTRSGAGLFNTTFFAVVGSLTYLICNPLLKAIYALRCFYAESVQSGADLTAELRALPRPSAALASILIACLIFTSSAIAAPESPASETPLTRSARELDRSIDETLKRSEFSWKLPRQPEIAEAKNKWPLVDTIGRFLKKVLRATKRAFEAAMQWIDRLFAPRNPQSGARPSGAGWHAASQGFMIALIVVLIVAALALLAQVLLQVRRRRMTALPTAPKKKTINLEDETVTADLLPENEWLALAHEHLAKGEVRLALRALFLSGLAHLGAREILTLARHKSNRDYQHELRRKMRDQPPLLEAFGQNIAAVERVWYGNHWIDADGIRQFESNLDRIRAC